MRNLKEITEDLKKGKEIPYEEAVAAANVYMDLLISAEKDIENLLYGNKLLRYDIENTYKERHNIALYIEPDKYM